MFTTRRHLANSISSNFILNTHSRVVEKPLEQRIKEGQKSLREFIYLLKPLQVRIGWERWVKSESVGWALCWAKEIKS